MNTKKRQNEKVQLETIIELKKKGRGAFDGCIDLNSSCSIMRWYDDKAVQLAWNNFFTEPVDTALRWSKKEKNIYECFSITYC